jgi:vacuolar-type H+-ATPase subunit I/STV1
MEAPPVSRSTTGWTAGRVLVGLLIPAPFLILAWAAAAVNNTYFRDEWDPLAFWLNSMIVIGPAIIVAGLVMFFRFRRPEADRMGTLAGGAIFFLVLAILVWWV